MVLPQEGAPTGGEGTLICREEEGFLAAFSARLQAGTLPGTMLPSLASGAGARAVPAFTATASLGTLGSPGGTQPDGLADFC